MSINKIPYPSQDIRESAMDKERNKEDLREKKEREQKIIKESTTLLSVLDKDARANKNGEHANLLSDSDIEGMCKIIEDNLKRLDKTNGMEYNILIGRIVNTYHRIGKQVEAIEFADLALEKKGIIKKI